MNTAAKEDRISLLKPIDQIQYMDDNSEDLYLTSLIERYAARPDQLDHMCLAEFAANYTTCSGHELTEDENTDELPLAEDNEVGRCESIKLQYGLRQMYRRKRETISSEQ